MKALRVNGTRAEVMEVAAPDDNGEALIRVSRSGICNTDLEIVRGYAGFNGTIGHEFVGIVEAVGGSPGWIGKRVVGEINAGCGDCELCAGGDSRHCATRTVLGIHGRDGAHAEYLTLPARNLIEVPENVSDGSAVFAEPLAAAYGIAERVDVTPDTTVAVIGDGKLGLLCSMTMRLRSTSVSLIGKHKEKIARAVKRDVEGILLEATNTRKKYFDVVVEASGSESGFATALDLVKPRGTIVLKSTFHGAAGWDASRVVVDEISVIGSRCGRLAPAVELLSTGSVWVDDLITDEFALTDGVTALDQASKPGVLKVLLRP